MSKKVIVDTDVGTDDAFALITLLQQNTEIKAITCVNGNTTVEHVYNNVQRILKLCKRQDIPVFLGTAEPLLYTVDECKTNFHGQDGFGDLEHKDDIKTQNTEDYQNYNAVAMINKIVSENPQEISLICLGPLTNIALAIKMYPEFRKNVKDIYIMGGNYKGVGNTTSHAEFNFYVDPEAAYIVLHFIKCSIIVLPWEPCLDSNITFDWRYNVLGKSKHPTMKLLNAAEKSVYAASEKIWMPCDAFLTAIFLQPSIAKKSFLCNISVELHGSKTRAQMLINHCEKNMEPNASIVTEVDMKAFKSFLLDSFNK